MRKLNVILTPTDLDMLTQVLEYALTCNDMSTLKRQRLEHYLALSCLHEFFNKLDRKNNDIKAFGFPPGKSVRVPMSRSEALAFYIICTSTSTDFYSFLPAVHITASNVLREINGAIHKQFLA